MKPCFGYLRVSSKKQGEGTSLDAQREAIEAFAYRNDITITRWFVETVTAAKQGRPEFNAMIKLLRQKKAAGMVMHKIDRSARNFFDWARIGELSDAGVEIHFATESLDFTSRGGRLAANIQMAVAEDYCRNLREEVKKGQAGCLKQGLYPFKAPIGYLDNGKGQLKTPDPVRAPFIVQAFELYATGTYSTRTLRLELQKRGLRNHYDRPISKCCLEKCLRNPFYTGVIHIRRTGAVYRGKHKPLISAKLFQTVQDVRTGKSGKKVTRHNHTYRGLFKCAECNNTMIAEKQKAHVYYRCHTMACPGNCVREDALEAAIHGMLARVRFSGAHIDAIIAATREWGRKTVRASTEKSLSFQLGKTEGRLEKLLDALVDGAIDNEVFSKRKQELLIEQTRLRQEVEQQRENRVQPHLLRQFLERIKTLAEHYDFANQEEKRLIAEIATSNRKVRRKNVYLEPANWLLAAETALTGLLCADAHTNYRTRPELRQEQLKALNSLIASEEVAAFEDVFSKEPEDSTISE